MIDIRLSIACHEGFLLCESLKILINKIVTILFYIFMVSRRYIYKISISVQTQIYIKNRWPIFYRNHFPTVTSSIYLYESKFNQSWVVKSHVWNLIEWRPNLMERTFFQASIASILNWVVEIRNISDWTYNMVLKFWISIADKSAYRPNLVLKNEAFIYLFISFALQLKKNCNIRLHQSNTYYLVS